MSAAAVLRAAGIGVAIVAVADPACTRERQAPLPVVVRADSPDGASVGLADRVREELATQLGESVDLEPASAPAAVVLTGADGAFDRLAADVRVSVVTDGHPSGRNVRVGGVASSPFVAGWPGTISASITAVRAGGHSSVITLEHEDLELGRIEHNWTADSETFEARFEYLPPAAGIRPMRIVVHPSEGETTLADNQADVRLTIADRTLGVLVYEPRPSWTTTFIRRALEQEPLFDVAALGRPSRGIELRAGAAPDRLRADGLDGFDVVVVGAPEELRQDEIDAFVRFARLRGGTLLLAPDRRPSGAFTKLVPVRSFSERLLDAAIPIRGAAGSLRASELAVPVEPRAGVSVLAGLERDGRVEPVVFAWPLGAGQAIFSGALDAWRHRAEEDGFAVFWRAHVAAAAIASPPRIEATLEPGLAVPGQTVTVRARVRATEVRTRLDAIEFPRVSARLMHPDGAEEPIRLWPTAEAGLFEGRVTASHEGTYAVQATAGGSTADTALVVSRVARPARGDAPRALSLLARSSGGVVVPAADLSVLETHLASLARPMAAGTIYPARSRWWMAAFVTLLCAEWGLRRRRGLR